MNKRILFAIVLILGCSTSTSQTPPPAQPQAQPKSQFKNLQVFDKNISRDELIAAMKGFTRGLGVRCEFCHVVTATEPKEQFDFAADTKEEKRIGREMIRMVLAINSTYLPRAVAVEKKEPDRVSCWTCHRGKEEPEEPPPPPPPPPRS